MNDPKFYRPSRFAAELKRQARILDGPEHRGVTIDELDKLIDKVGVVRVTHTDTPSTAAGWAYEESNCTDCGAAYGHKHFCPKVNRQAAEAASSLLSPTEADVIRARGLGVIL